MSPRRRRDRYRHGGPWANSHGRVRRYVSIPMAVIGAVLAVLLVGWAIDSKVHSDEVARGVTSDERSVSGEDAGQLDDELSSVAQSWAAVPVKVNTPKGAIDISKLGG